jgi:dihydroorotate dehydrogenase subfamily 2
MKSKVMDYLYKTVFKPVAFALDAEFIHDSISSLGETLENFPGLVSFLFDSPHADLKKKVLGVEFTNPVGLSAGFDYNGHLAQVLSSVGFGFNSVGTVTAKAYEGNPKPRLMRLPKSKSLLVNKGFKSEGAPAVAGRLDGKKLEGKTIGISVGSSNCPEVDTVNKAIDDYLFTFDLFKNKKYAQYFELNISCPNTEMTESFTEINNYEKLISAIAGLKLKQPVFVKMPNEMTTAQSDEFVTRSLKKDIKGFIFANLVKDRNNPAFDKAEMRKFDNLKGNFSGKPTEAGANQLVAHTRKKFGTDVAIIGCGGIFSPEDAIRKLAAGADLIQLITGMIYEGPTLIGEINQEIANRRLLFIDN